MYTYKSALAKDGVLATSLKSDGGQGITNPGLFFGGHLFRVYKTRNRSVGLVHPEDGMKVEALL